MMGKQLSKAFSNPMQKARAKAMPMTFDVCYESKDKTEEDAEEKKVLDFCSITYSLCWIES